jgi:hypothetical protein
VPSRMRRDARERRLHGDPVTAVTWFGVGLLALWICWAWHYVGASPRSGRW